jgi:hypothetical protein
VAKSRYRVAGQSPNSRQADASQANVKEVESKDPLKWISFAAVLDFGSKRKSLTAGIRNSIIRQNGNCKKQTNKPSQNSRANARRRLAKGIWAVGDF